MALNLKQMTVYLAIAFVLVTIWQDTHGSSESMGAFLGSAGDFFTNVVDKGAEFVDGLID